MGHKVYGTSRKPGQGAAGPFTVMDITDDASVVHAVRDVLQREGRIDVLVNNAGLGIQGPIEDTPVELAMRLLDTNLMGAHRLCRAVLPHMRERGSGLIINISSIAGNFGLPYRGFYSASKAALDRYGEALATEVQRFGIDVVTVQPGEFATNIKNVRLTPDHISDAHRPGYERAMEVLSGSMHYSRDPDELARVVARIIRTPKPRAVYHVAQGKQKLSVLLKKLLPGRMFSDMVRRHYE